MEKSSVDEEKDTQAQEVVLTRVFDAPRELVWKAWTEPDRLSRWWGPKGFTSPVNKVDLRVGGEILNLMRSPEGEDFWSKGTYQEIVPPERLVVTDSFSDEEGNVVPATYYGMGEDWPLEALITITFEEFQGKTRMTLRYSGVSDVHSKEVEDMKQGWNESFDKLDEELAG